MFPAQLHAVLLPLLLLATVFAGVAAQSDQAVALDFSDVIFNPPEVWHSALSNECGPGGTDHYTVQMNASAQFNFVGDRIQVSGISNNASGVMQMVMDDLEPRDTNAWSNDVMCQTFVEWFLENGTHTLTITLIAFDPIVNPTTVLPGNEEGQNAPVLHLTNITYFVPVAATEESTAAPTAGDLASDGSSHKDIAAIVAGSVCGAVGLAALLLGAFLVWKKRSARTSRHQFDPSPVYITELSPRTAATPDSADKYGAYTRFDDDVETKSIETKAGVLTVPQLQYSPNKGGLRARSRSPMPDRKPAP